MDTTDSAPPVETAAASPNPATAPAAPSSSEVETPSSPLSTFDDDQIEASFQSRNAPPADPANGEQSEKTEEQAQPPADEQQPTDGKSTEVQTPPEEPDPKDELPTQIRPRLSSPDDLAIAAIQKARGLPSFGEAAKVYYGMGQQPAPTPPGAAEPPPSSEPTPAQKLEADIATLAAEVKIEREGTDGEYLTPAHLEKADRLADLRSDLKLAKFQEAQVATARQQGEAATVAKAHDDSMTTVRRDYPTISDGTTPLGKTATAVIAEWNADPVKQARLAEPNAPQLVAAEAAFRAANELFTAGKFPTLDLAIASLKAATTAAPKAPAPLSSAPPAAPQQQPPPARRVAPAPGVRTQTQPVEPPNSTALLSQVGFDPDAASEALYGPNRITALGR